MLGIGRGISKGGAALRSIIKKNLQAWYKCDTTQAPLGEEEITNGDFSLGAEVVINGDFKASGVGNAISQSGGVLSNTSNRLNINGDGVQAYGRAVWDTNGLEGNSFLIEADVISTVGGVRFIDISTNVGKSLISGERFSATITMGSSAKQVGFGGSNDANFELILDNISIQQTNPNDSWGTHNVDVDNTVEFQNEGVRIVHVADGTAVGIRQNNVFTPGKKYNVIVDATINSGSGIKVNQGNNAGVGSITTSGIHEFNNIIAAEHQLEIFRRLSSASDTTVNSISVKEITNSVRDYSKNNNNAVLYSGKALELDGDGDYIDIDYWKSKVIDANTKATFAIWFNSDDVTGGDVFLGSNHDSNDRFYLAAKSSKLDLGWGTSAWTNTPTSGTLPAVINNTWYRVVMVIDGLSCHIYMNNEWVFTKTNASSFTLDDNGIYLGQLGDSTSGYYWDGKLADFQIYDKAWTASDVKYDWENPDGDVFDDQGRVEVLGAELVTDGGFANGTTSWSENSNWAYNAGGSASSDGETPADTSINQGNVMVVGRVYVVSFEITSFTSGDGCKIRAGSGTTYSDAVTTVGVHSFTQTCAINESIYVKSGNSICTIDNISVKEITTHASTILPTDCKALYRLNEGAGDRVYNAAPVLGAELVTNGDLTSGLDNWTTTNTDSTHTVTHTSKGARFIADTTGVVTTLSSPSPIIVGGTYKLEVVISEFQGSAGIKIDNGNITPSPLIFNSVGTFVYTFIATATTSTPVSFYRNGGDVDITIQSVSVKEVTLSNSYALAGDPEWATAQPYIPQYAMSSYSKKMVFTGIDEKVDLGETNTIADDAAFSISFWYQHELTGDTNYVIGNNSGEDWLRVDHSADEVVLRINNSSFTFDVNESTLNDFKLAHLCITRVAGATGSLNLYVNGVFHSTITGPVMGEWVYRYFGSQGGTASMNGFIDEIAIFDTELSANEVSELFNGGMALDARALESPEWLNLTGQGGGLNTTTGTVSPVVIESSNSLSFDDTVIDAFDYEGDQSTNIWQAAFGEYVYQQPFTMASGDTITVSGRITKNDGTYGLYTDTDNDGSINFRIQAEDFSVGLYTSGSSDYHVDANGRFSFNVTLTTSVEIFNIQAQDIEFSGTYTSGTGVPGVLVSELSIKRTNLRTNLNGYWRNNGADEWTDLSLRNNHGTVNGSPTTIQLQEVPYFGKDSLGLPMNRLREGGLNFDGASYVKISDDTSLDVATTNEITVECWYKARNTSSYDAIQYLIASEAWSVADGWGLGANATQIFFSAQDADVGGGGNEDAVFVHSDNTNWIHIVATNDETNHKIYINGELKDTGPADIAMVDKYPIYIGSLGTGSFTKGIIDDAKIYNKVLTATEITKNYKATKGRHKN